MVLSEVAMDVATFVAFRTHDNWLLVRFFNVNLEAPSQLLYGHWDFQFMSGILVGLI